MSTETNLINRLQDDWNTCSEALTHAARTCERINRDATKATGLSYLGYNAFDNYAAEQAMCKTAERLVNTTINHAEKVLAAPGSKLNIERHRIAKALAEHGRSDTLNLVALWQAIEAVYGGEEGLQASYEQAAEKIIQQFGIHRSHEIKRKRGGIELETYVHTENRSWRGGPGRVLGYQTQLSLLDLVQAINTVIVDAGCTPAQSGQWLAVGDQINDMTQKAFTSRTKLRAAGIEITFFYGKATVLIPNAWASHLLVFLAEHGHINDQAA